MPFISYLSKDLTLLAKHKSIIIFTVKFSPIIPCTLDLGKMNHPLFSTCCISLNYSTFFCLGWLIGWLVGWLVIYLFIHLCIYLFIYLWLCWVFVSVQGLSLVAASGGHSSSRCVGLSLSWPLLLRSTGSRRAGSVVVAHGPSCSTACGILPDQGSNPCPLH